MRVSYLDKVTDTFMYIGYEGSLLFEKKTRPSGQRLQWKKVFTDNLQRSVCGGGGNFQSRLEMYIYIINATPRFKLWTDHKVMP